jgi:hypothetical protein
MLQQSPVLSSKIKIDVDYDKTDYSERHVSFYTKYSCFTLKALRKSSFQKFLGSMLLSENIEETIVNTIDIEVYPASRKKGNYIAGRCNVFKGNIRIYPKTIKFCNVFRRKFGQEILFAYAGSRARAALIHELLHLKYVSDEEKVRELTKIYFYAYSKNHLAKSSNAVRMCEFIFDAKSFKILQERLKSNKYG